MLFRVGSVDARRLLLALLVLTLWLLIPKVWERQWPHLRIARTSTTSAELDVELRGLEQELPEVDFSYWERYALPGNYRVNRSCAQYPDPLSLQVHNVYWQTFLNANVTFRLYAAYLDTRAAQNTSRGIVRLLVTANQIKLQFPYTYCQLWFPGYREPVMSFISRYTSVWPTIWSIEPRLNYPHLLNCPVPKDLPAELEGSTPSTVSLTTASCEHASNSLRINYEKSTSSSRNSSSPLSIGVCLKAFEFPFEDISQRLVEWFEMQRLLGASRVYAYVYTVHPAVERTLKYYTQSGFLELRPLTMANGAPRLPHYLHRLLNRSLLVKRLNELIPYNDCFYRNMYKHDYLLNVDIDEVIMPAGQVRNWQTLLETLLMSDNSKFQCPEGYASLCFIQSLFTIDSQNSDELFLLHNTMRQRNYTEVNIATKCFHNTRYSLTLHNHYTILSLPGVCNRHFLGTDLAQMQHYTNKLGRIDLSDLVEDRSVWKYAKELRSAVDYALEQLKS